MKTLKHDTILILLCVLLVAACVTTGYRCKRPEPSGPSFVSDPTASAAFNSPFTDPTTLGAIVTAILSAAGVIWKALQRRDVAAVVDGIGKLKETLKGGAELAPDAMALGDLLHELYGGMAKDNPEIQLWHRVNAEKLLAKYTITLKP